MHEMSERANGVASSAEALVFAALTAHASPGCEAVRVVKRSRARPRSKELGGKLVRGKSSEVGAKRDQADRYPEAGA